jgi:hypothetical protein
MSTEQPTVTYKPIPDFPGYRVGSDGSVWSCWKRGGFGCVYIPTGHWRRLVTPPDKLGYPRVKLRGRRRRKIHRLVLEAFVGPCPDGMHCCHADDDKANNALTNLRWDTQKANMADAGRNGHIVRGEAHCGSKLTAEIVRAIRAEYAAGGVSQARLARKYGVTGPLIGLIVRRKRWKHV